MWIWWIISLIILIACVIFAWRMIVSSYEFLPSDKRYFWKFGKDTSSENDKPARQSDSIRKLNMKVQAVEDNTTFYQIQFTKFQERLRALEDAKFHAVSATQAPKKQEEEEDWKEMYFEENEAKEKLENELDATNHLLEESQNKLKELSENSFRWIQLQSDYESRLLELQSRQNQVEILQNQLNAAGEREKELEQLLISEITVREKYSMLQKEYIELQSEADDLRRRMIELSKRDLHLEMRLVHLNELESKLAICEEEKSKLKARIENHLLG